VEYDEVIMLGGLENVCVMWVPLITARRVLGLRMEETASTYGR